LIRLPLLLAVLLAPSILGASVRASTLLDYCFPEQRAAIEDPAAKKTLWCTGRAGKTTAVMVDYCHDGMEQDHKRYIYVAKTLESAMEISWPILKDLNRDFGLGLQFVESRNRVTMPSGSWIKIYGADRPGWMDKLYGQAWRRLAVDEAGFFGVDLRAFIDDIVEMRGADHDGQLYLMSIPGRLPRGLFHDVIKGFTGFELRRGEVSPDEPDWSVHSWTWRENDAVADKIAALIKRKVAANPEIVNTANFRRNYLGETVVERGERVYAYSEEFNTYANEWGNIGADGYWQIMAGDRYVLGLDFGWDDHWAFSVVCYRGNSPLLVEVESYTEPELMMDVAASHVRRYMDTYPDLSIVADPQFKAYFEEFRRRYDLPIVPAEKQSKFDWIEVVNGDLEQGRVKFLDPKGPHVEEMKALIWKVGATGLKKEAPGCLNNACDAFLYAYRWSYHYRYEVEETGPEPGSPEWYAREEKRIIEQLIAEDEAEE